LEKNLPFQIATDFVQYTNEHVFLTGNAGTGKTTFLRHIKNTTKKNIAITAPTGIPAIHVGGVTLHSLLYLPMGMYVPVPQRGFSATQYADKNTVLRNLRMNEQKRQLINKLDLLVIDEVSMVRADMMDCVDTILKYVRRNNEPFGGLQMLFIGDLFQLPPVVKEDEKATLLEHYRSPYFFDAQVIQQINLIKIELKKIYRQSDETFIQLLQNIRNNQLEEDDHQLLLERYKPTYANYEKHIVLTTHNNKADKINAEKLDEIPGATTLFKGEFKGEFSENNPPAEVELKLKKGAQIMLLKNNPDGNYYNGSLAEISDITTEGLFVTLKESDATIKLEKEKWRSIRYKLNADDKVEEEEVGSFTQYPIRLAWAVTIHKSQGLTFDNVVVDAGQSFAPGQVYVALSRCTTLGGITLLSMITKNSLYSDAAVLEFCTTGFSSEKNLLARLKPAKELFAEQMLQKAFDVTDLYNYINTLKEKSINKRLTTKQELFEVLDTMNNKTQELESVANKFVVQLGQVMQGYKQTGEVTLLKERTEKAVGYFTNFLASNFIAPLVQYIDLIKKEKGVKQHLRDVEITKQQLSNKIIAYSKLEFGDLKFEDAVAKNLIEASTALKSTDVARSAKEAKIATHQISYTVFSEGKTIAQIAEERNLAISTIEGHLAIAIANGQLPVEKLLPKEKLNEILVHKALLKEQKAAPVKELLGDDYSYAEIRWAIAYLKYSNQL
jgi:hypothetical protein